MRPSKECFHGTLLLGPGPRTLQPVEDLVAIVDTRSRFMLANEHQRICKRTDDPSVTQVKRGVDRDLSWVRHGTTPPRGRDVGHVQVFTSGPTPQLCLDLHAPQPTTAPSVPARR